MLIMVAILVVVVIIRLSVSSRVTGNVRVMRYWWFMVKLQGKSLPSFIMEVLLSYGRLFKDTNSSP